MKKFKFGFVTIMVALILTACGNNSIVGRWEKTDGSTFKRLEFFSDSTYSSNEDNYAGGYSAENGRLKLEGILMETKTYSYEVDGDILTLYSDKGSVIGEYKRVKN